MIVFHVIIIHVTGPAWTQIVLGFSLIVSRKVENFDCIDNWSYRKVVDLITGTCQSLRFKYFPLCHFDYFNINR